MPITTIAFDADDTLWHHDTFFGEAQNTFEAIISHYLNADDIKERLMDAHIKNFELFGFGVKSFTLSMVETALEMTNYKITGADMQKILDEGIHMMTHPINLLPGVERAINAAHDHGYEVFMITKGDFFDQEARVARSGLADRFDHIEIVPKKEVAVYQEILDRLNIAPDEFMMIGNSPGSDIIPVLKLGGHAVHIPYGSIPSFERTSIGKLKHTSYIRFRSLEYLPRLLDTLAANPESKLSDLWDLFADAFPSKEELEERDEVGTG